MKVTGSGEVAGKHPGAEADSWVISAPSEVDRGSWPRAHVTRSHASQWRCAAEVLHDGVSQRDDVLWSQGDGLLGSDREGKEEGACCATERQPWLRQASSSIARGRQG